MPKPLPREKIVEIERLLAAGLSQQEVADRTGIHRHTVQRISVGVVRSEDREYSPAVAGLRQEDVHRFEHPLICPVCNRPGFLRGGRCVGCLAIAYNRSRGIQTVLGRPVDAMGGAFREFSDMVEQ